MGEFSETTTIEAPRDAVWDLISVQQNWSIWTPAREVILDPPGDPVPDGVGAVRAMRVVGPIAPREEILEYEPPEHMAYRLVAQFPTRNYVAHMRLDDDGGVTRLEWSAKWDDRFGFAAGVVARSLTRIVRKMSDGIKAEAEQRAAGDG